MKKLAAAGIAVSLAAAVSVALIRGGAATAVACPHGFHLLSVEESRHDTSLRLHAYPRLASAALHRMSGVCVNDNHPELYDEVAGLAAQRAAMTGVSAPNAYAHAVAQRRALIARHPAVAGASGTWTPYGKGPLIAEDPRFGSVNGEGLDNLSGRVDSFAFDPKGHRLFATVGTGGVWMSTNLGRTWRSVGDNLPTQVIGAVGWTKAGGGTLIASSGEPLMGGDTYTGMGGFWSNDLGKHWHKAKGIPNGGMSWQVVPSPFQPRTVYMATSQGLFRSTNAGRSFVNEKLPTGPCKGKTGYGPCEFANFVTDVVVKTPGGSKHTRGGGVLAVVGYRAGAKAFSNGKPESPRNGLYRSATGKPGSFKKLAAPGFAAQDHIGRVALGEAIGPKQDHNFVYAIVEDAKIFNDGQAGQVDAPETGAPAASNTTINGVYVSKDFGKSWTQLANTNDIAENPHSDSALAGTGQAQLYAPGVQAWYNEWIKVDPTRQAAKGVPTRVLFGLEEVWANRDTTQPLDGSTQNSQGDFHVIGPYFADKTCLFVSLGLPSCPTQATTKRTTHPDQHAALFLPDKKGGGVTLFVGNDGGVFQQHAKKGQELVATGWGQGGTNNGFHSLLPYDAEMAKDGRTWFGLQDNGSGYVDASTQKQFMAFGGDGFYVAVDPNNSNTAYTEVTGANMRVTTDGGQTWRDMGPIDQMTASSNTFQFANPFVMDPTDANHLMTAGTQVLESTFGSATQQMDPQDTVCSSNCWTSVFDLSSGGNSSAGMSSLDLSGDAAYVGFCGPCDLLNHWSTGFTSGIATNVGGTKPPKRMTSDGWHFAKAQGLPKRYITDIAIDPNDPKTVYVTLGGYTNRQWVPPGSYLDPNKSVGVGHVYKSTDAGETFTNVSKGLPNAPAFTIKIHGSQLVVGTQVGVFLSSTTNGGTWAALSKHLPNAPINQLSIDPGDPNVLVAAVFGRGVYTYRFP